MVLEQLDIHMQKKKNTQGTNFIKSLQMVIAAMNSQDMETT